MNATSLSRSTSFWLLLILSVAATALGGWLVWDSTTTMLTTILDGTATNVEVYVGQAWITSGAALLAAGLVGIFLSLVVNAAKALIPRVAVVAADASSTTPSTGSATVSATRIEPDAEIEPDAADEPDGATESDPATLEDQNGSSGSIATATNNSVR
ncbi:hypothetical protein [Microbacterium sp.]|uniref:hypothetical protein n=1 Tax=Microbacterium sp. TaxID=51671 RepID=UPI002601E574|nr:hypothetical protein [Microbacterium sp.]